MRLTEQDREALTAAIRPPTKWGDNGKTVLARLLDADDAAFAMETLAPAVEAIVTRQVEEALREFADDNRRRMAEAWGGSAAWFTTGEKVADVVCDWLREEGRVALGD